MCLIFTTLYLAIGFNSPFSSQQLYGLLLLALLVSICGLLSFAMSARGIEKRERTRTQQKVFAHRIVPHIPLDIPVVNKRTGLRNAIRTFLFLSLGTVVGYVGHDLQQFSHIYTLTDLIVTRDDGSGQYGFRFADNHDEFTTKFCPDYRPRFFSGLKLKELVYQDRGACWDISDQKLGYVVDPIYRKEHQGE